MKAPIVVMILLACMTATAGATPSWSIAPDLTELVFLPGSSVWVDLRGYNPTVPNGFQGFELYAVVSGPFEISSVLVDQLGAATGFEGNSTGAYIDFSSGNAIAMVTTASGYVPDGSIMARLCLTALPSAIVGEIGYLSTDGTDFWGAASNFADGQDAAQDTLRLIIPEPLTTLLLLPGLPLLTRRR